MFERAVLRTNGCGSNQFLVEEIKTMEEKIADTKKTEKRLHEKRKQMETIVGEMRSVK